MKKITALFMGLVMVFGLTACGSGGSNQSNTGSKKTSGSTAATGSSKTTGTSAVSDNTSGETVNSVSASAKNSSGKTLVVYYSATGNTENVAKIIASEANAELFELEPVEPYSDADLDWTKSDSRVSKEHDDESLRDVKLKSTAVPDWDKYDTVYVGYPIWWHTAPMTVGTFLESYDWSGKTIYPVSQSASMDSSQYNESVEFIKKNAKGAIVDNGIFSTDSKTIGNYIDSAVK